MGNCVDNRLNRIYWAMKGRCEYPKNVRYSRYGGRGISVEFQSYREFREWAYQNGYSPTLTIDRIDKDKNYSPENCRWITHYENTQLGSLKYWYQIDRVDGSIGYVTNNLTEFCREHSLTQSALSRVGKTYRGKTTKQHKGFTCQILSDV
ncbi:hypothetical protein [Vibrio phage JSF27]|uniref:Homing endonuclease n=2 Tax=Icepovirus bengalense TaxID=2846603 RepID=A0A2D0YYV6_9CAUD|nr:HNH endonuclease [Vibrio phage ICP2]ADX87733.1 hypothetical protein [Vibrio phage ICP2]ASV43844.1 hypothetical protein [Vibrio phage JSF27]